MRAFYDEHFPALYRYVLCRVDNRHAETEEIVEESFYQAFRDAASYDSSRASPRAWLVGIARHRVLDFLRRRQRQPVQEVAFSRLDEDFVHSLSDMDRVDLPSQAMERAEVRQLVDLALSELPSDYEQLLRLRYIDNLSVKDMARSLQTSDKSVEARLFRARNAFRDTFTALAKTAAAPTIGAAHVG